MKKMVVALLCAFMLVGCGNAGGETNVEEITAIDQAVEKESDLGSQKEAVEETIEDTNEDASDVDIAERIDITGCDTFTEIVDKALEPGMGYTNVTLGDTDALLVCSGAYDNMDGNMAAIDSAIYIYDKDGMPRCIGSVASNGTSYPLAEKDGFLYGGIFHGTCVYTIKNGELIEVECAWTEYDSDDNESYYYAKDGEDAVEVDSVDKQSAIEEKYYDANVLNFDVIK